MPLGHLIALISNAHLRKRTILALCGRKLFSCSFSAVNTAYRKTSCIEIDPNEGLRLASQRSPHTRPAPHDDKRRGPDFDAPRPTWTSVGCPRHGRIPSSRCQKRRRCEAAEPILFVPWTHLGLVEPDGIEPTTSCLQSRRSPN